MASVPSSSHAAVFPVARVHKGLRRQTHRRVSRTAAVYMAAVLEYLTAELVEIAGNEVLDEKRRRIMPRHVRCAVHGDEELYVLTGAAIIPHASVREYIHPALWSAQQTKRERTRLEEWCADAEKNALEEHRREYGHGEASAEEDIKRHYKNMTASRIAEFEQLHKKV